MLVDQTEAIPLALGKKLDRVHAALETHCGYRRTVNRAFCATST